MQTRREALLNGLRGLAAGAMAAVGLSAAKPAEASVPHIRVNMHTMMGKVQYASRYIVIVDEWDLASLKPSGGVWNVIDQNFPMHVLKKGQWIGLYAVQMPNDKPWVRNWMICSAEAD